MKKISIYQLGVCSILVFSGFFMSGCTLPFAQQNTPSGPVTLTYESLWEPQGTYEELFNSYKSQNPTQEIVFNDKSGTDLALYKKDLLSRLQSGINTPDVVRIHISWLEEFKPYLQGKIYNQSDFDNFYYPGVANVVAEKVVDKPEYFVYGIPYYLDALMLVYNKDHFQDSGVRAVPNTWEQFFSTSALLTRKDTSGNVLRSGAAYGSSDLEFYTDIFGYLLSSTSLIYPEGVSYDSDTLKSVLRVLNRSTDWNPLFMNSGTAIASRGASMAILPLWRVNDILVSNPTLDLGVAPLPQADISSPVIWPSYFIEVVPKSSKNSANAWNLITFMSSPEGIQSIYSKQASVRRLPSLPAQTDFTTKNQVDPYLQELSTYLKSATSPHFDGSAIVFSDRSGNNDCVSKVKSVIITSSSENLISSLPSIQEVCKSQ